MKRMHIHVAVENLSDSIRFYSAMFGNAEPTVLKTDYCKWELTNPAVNFAISERGARPGVDHLGIQVETDAELAEMNARFVAAELPVQVQTDTTCCYAWSDKAWMTPRTWTSLSRCATRLRAKSVRSGQATR